MVTKPRFSREEFSRRGDEIYERQVAPQVESRDAGKFVAIDIETGAFEVASDELVASDRLLDRLPGAQVWLRQIGTRFAHRFGPRHPVGLR